MFCCDQPTSRLAELRETSRRGGHSTALRRNDERVARADADVAPVNRGDCCTDSGRQVAHAMVGRNRCSSVISVVSSHTRPLTASVRDCCPTTDRRTDLRTDLCNSHRAKRYSRLGPRLCLGRIDLGARHIRLRVRRSLPRRVWPYPENARALSEDGDRLPGRERHVGNGGDGHRAG
jgi:hypothetical protein